MEHYYFSRRRFEIARKGGKQPVRRFATVIKSREPGYSIKKSNSFGWRLRTAAAPEYCPHVGCSLQLPC